MNVFNVKYIFSKKVYILSNALYVCSDPLLKFPGIFFGFLFHFDPLAWESVWTKIQMNHLRIIVDDAK